ncbi:unnamed protein product [Umbelopsis sp. WA50703]
MSVPQLVLSPEHSTTPPAKGILKRRPSAPSTLQRSSSWLASINSRIGSALHGSADPREVQGAGQPDLDTASGRLIRSQTVDSLSFQLSKATVSPKLALEGAELKRVRFSVVQLTQVQLYDRRDDVPNDDIKTEQDEIKRKHPSLPDNIPKVSQRQSSLRNLQQIPLSPTNVRTKNVVPDRFSPQNLLEIYHTACRAREEVELPIVRAILESRKMSKDLKQMNLSRNTISQYTAEPLSDILSLDTGLAFLDLSFCELSDTAMKIILHSLLVSDRLKSLALAGNTKLTSKGFTYLSVYISKSQSLKYLDISSMNIDKKSAHSLSQSLSLATSLQTLMMDSCNLSPAVLDMLSGDIRNSISLHDMSLRGNNFSKKAFPPLSSILYSPIELPQDVGCTGLISLDLSGNDLRYGARLLANALAQNNQLQSLILRNCQLDSTLLAPLAEAIKQNTSLRKLDLSCNPLNIPHQDGIYALKLSLFMNRTMADICLAKCQLDSEAAIAIAECLPENNALLRLDLSENPQIGIAGLLALSVSVKMSSSLTFLDITIPLNDPDMAHLQNDIVSACTRNAQTLYDNKESLNRELLKVEEPLCDTGSSSPSLEQTASSLSLNDIISPEATEAHMAPLETLKSNIDRSSHELSDTIQTYRTSGKEIVDENLHVSVSANVDLIDYIPLIH